MTPKERTAMQQALEALHNIGNALMCLTAAMKLRPIYVEMRDNAANGANEAITALREALDHSGEATEMVQEPCHKNRNDYCKCERKTMLCDGIGKEQPVRQEPVGYFAYDEEQQCWYQVIDKDSDGAVAFYTAPQPVKEVELTDEEIEWLVVDTLETWNSKDTMKDFARAVIAAYKEKNK